MGPAMRSGRMQVNGDEFWPANRLWCGPTRTCGGAKARLLLCPWRRRCRDRGEKRAPFGVPPHCVRSLRRRWVSHSPVLKHDQGGVRHVCESTASKPVRRKEVRSRIPNGCTADRPRPFEKWFECEHTRRTRKMVNYASSGRGRPRGNSWRPAADTDVQIVRPTGHVGERLIEPSSSRFPPKFPSDSRSSVRVLSAKPMIRGMGTQRLRPILKL
ncbi:hypothetical protein Syun_031897 [Stephania yunnanensis]|uniref:Uncharacterized protein n=1 Tax=Stephania yunnanensis TaxID=152371 RepID=A0AAP0DTU0_9MAGN